LVGLPRPEHGHRRPVHLDHPSPAGLGAGHDPALAADTADLGERNYGLPYRRRLALPVEVGPAGQAGAAKPSWCPQSQDASTKNAL
jgi:hypothetical protein